MPVTIPFGSVTIGGDHSDNEPDYSWTTYDDYPGLDLTKVYLRIDVIAYHAPSRRDLKVTGLALVVGGKPQTDGSDLCTLPCPKFC